MKKANTYLACSLIAASLVVLGGIASASLSFNDPVGTVAQVTAAVKSSVATKTLSAPMQATLKQYSNPSNNIPTGPTTFGVCDPYNSEALALAPKPCFFGNLHGSKTIVLLGDSNVGNWVPALSIGLASTPYRLAVFGFSSCGLANLPYTSSWGSLFERCRQWHENLPAAVRALHPVAVLAASGAVGTVYSDQVWVNGVKNVFVQATLGSPSTKRILMGTSPLFPQSAVTCLTIHPDPQDCSLTYTPGSGYYGGVLLRDKEIAKAADATLINTSKFLCSKDTCSPVIGNILVYSDIDHVTIAYSSFISRSITGAVLAALNK